MCVEKKTETNNKSQAITFLKESRWETRSYVGRSTYGGLGGWVGLGWVEGRGGEGVGGWEVKREGGEGRAQKRERRFRLSKESDVAYAVYYHGLF